MLHPVSFSLRNTRSLQCLMKEGGRRTRAAPSPPRRARLRPEKVPQMRAGVNTPHAFMGGEPGPLPGGCAEPDKPGSQPQTRRLARPTSGCAPCTRKHLCGPRGCIALSVRTARSQVLRRAVEGGSSPVGPQLWLGPPATRSPVHRAPAGPRAPCWVHRV